ncbi:MAG TPA: MBL fold metallo-hydrolase [Candidatus Sulfotelmatobacter sp.]|nr:MBL fold metallo-hydrolase [Candidatus Sulfotelmatobacter sp.]
MVKLWMIGHSTILLEAGGKRLLTDPYFGLWGSLGYSRLRPPARTRQELENVDVVLVSHNHFDHVDRAFLCRLPPMVPVLAPSASAFITRLKGGRNVIGMKPWQKWVLGEISITAVPARHVTFTIGYVIEAEGKCIYFAGDTYFGAFMEKIGHQFRTDIALMPVTTYRVPMTMGEQSALRAVQTLSPRTVIPIHLGITPRLPLLRTGQTPESFQERVRQARLRTEVVILHEGENYVALEE